MKKYISIIVIFFCFYTSEVHSQERDIVITAENAGNISKLFELVEAAGLMDTLQGEGPFTVFAPTDAAFAALPEGTIEEWLKPENSGELTAILTYHVLPGRVLEEDLSGILSVKAVSGLDYVIGNIEELDTDGAKIIRGNIKASNGIIHVVDRLFLPISSGVPVGPDICDEFRWLKECGGDGEEDEGDSADEEQDE